MDAALSAGGPVRIGLPLDGWQLAVLNPGGKPVAWGEIGELVIGGVGLGRYLDHVGVADNPLQGLSLDSTLAPALATTKVPVASIDGPDQYDFWSNRVWGEVEERMLAAIGALGVQPADAGLQAAGDVPIGLTVTDVVDARRPR